MPESNLCVALFVRPSKERHQQGFGLFAQTFFSRALQRFVCLNPIGSLLCLCDPLREGISKAHFPLFKPHLKGSARLQGFTLRGQYFFSRALQGFSKASLSLFKPSSQGPCKVCMTESNLSLLCLCDPPREGFSKASVSLFKPFSQGLCKASARDPSFCSKILVKGYAREGFNERSSSSFIQSDTVPETNRYALPTS